MNKNTGAAKPETGKLAWGLLASAPFSHTGQAEAAQRSFSAITHARLASRPHPMETLNARTIRADRRRALKETAVFWLNILAVFAATLAAIKIANEAIANVTNTLHYAEKEILK
jgi:hypothetical protein